MALDFLGKLLGGIGSAGAAITGIAGLFGGSKKQKIPAEAQEALRLQSGILKGLAGEGSPEWTRMVDAERNDARTRLLQAVNEIVRQNKRSMTRGRAGVLLNPDRRDETIARALMGVYENEGDRAKAAARQNAMAILGGAGGMAQSAYGMQDRNFMNSLMRPAFLSMGLQGLGELRPGGKGDMSKWFSGLEAGAPSTTVNETPYNKFRNTSRTFETFGGV